MGMREMGGRVWLCVGWVVLGVGVGGCEYGGGPIIDPIITGTASIEVRVSSQQIEAPADSTIQVMVTAIARDYNGVPFPGAQITLGDSPRIGSFNPPVGMTNENGEVVSQYRFTMPHDSSRVTIEAKSGQVMKKLTLALHGT